jgi:hypothetical protein
VKLRFSIATDEKTLETGFRVDSVPEPATFLLLGFGAVIIRKFRA